MNSDKITTIAGAVLGILVAVGVLTADQASDLTKAIGLVAAVVIVVLGHQTNKV